MPAPSRSAGPGITDEALPFALRSTRHFSEESGAPRRQLDGGVPPAANGRGGGQTRPWRRGCPRCPCCGAVLVIARPDGVCPQKRPAGIEGSGVVAVVDPASRHATASVAGVQQAVSTIRFRRPGSGCPAVRCPVTWDGRPEGPALGCLLSTVRCPAVRCPAVWCPAVRPDASVSSHAQAVALGLRSSWPGDPDHQNRWRPLRLPGRRRLDRRPRRPGRGDAADVALVGGRSVATRAAGWVRAAAAALAR